MPREVGSGAGVPLQNAGRELLRSVVRVPQPGQRVPDLDLRPRAPCLDQRCGELPVPQGELRQRPLLPPHKPRVVQRAPQNEPRHGVQIGRECLAPKAHRLQRDRAPARERVQHAGRATTERVPDHFSEPVELRPVLLSPVEDAARGLLQLRVLAASPEALRNQMSGHASAQPPSALGVAGVGEERGQQHRAARGERPPRGPDVERGDVAVPDILLVDGVKRDLAEGQGGLGEAGTVGAKRHQGLFPPT